MPTQNISIKLNALRAQIKAGTDALERGDFIEVDDADLERYLERLTTPSPKHARWPNSHKPGLQSCYVGACPHRLEGNADFVRLSTAVCLNVGSRTNAIIVERAEGERGDNRARQGPPAVRFHRASGSLPGDCNVALRRVRSPSPMDFRVFILRHLELLNALGFWTVRVLFPRTLTGSMEAYRKAAQELLTKPVTPSQAEELIWFLRQSQATQLDASVADRARLQAGRRAFRSPRFAAIRRHWIAEGNRAVFLAASPAARDTLDRGRAGVECLELPHAYEHLFVLARKAARRGSQGRGDEALGMSGPPPKPA